MQSLQDANLDGLVKSNYTKMLVLCIIIYNQCTKVSFNQILNSRCSRKKLELFPSVKKTYL